MRYPTVERLTTLCSMTPLSARAMIVKRMDKESENVLLCRQEAKVEHEGESFQMSVLYDCGAMVSMITHRAAERAVLKPTSHEVKEVSGLNGTRSSSERTYMVPLVDHGSEVRTIQTIGVNKIAWMKEGILPPELETIFPVLAGKTASLKQKKGDVDILVELDNSRWLP